MTTETTTPTLWTTCACLDGKHHDPQAATRAHVSEVFAGIIARHTGRHVVLLSDLAVTA